MKKIARLFASSILKTTLLGMAITAAILAVVGSPDTIKQSVNDSGLYDSLVSGVLEEAKEESTETGRTSDINPEKLEGAVKEALPPETLQTSVEAFVDGTYRWLNGEVDTPDFRIDLTTAKSKFITAAGQAAESHVNSLAECTPEQAQSITPDTDVFSLPCRQPGLTAAGARQEIETELATSDSFLKDPVITSESIKNKEGRLILHEAVGAPEAFQSFRAMPWVFLGLSLLLGAVVLLLSETRRQGIKSLAISVGGTGIFLLLGVWVFGLVFNALIKPSGLIGRSVDNALQTSLLDLLRTLGSTFNRTILIYSLLYMAVGAGVLLALKFIQKAPPTLHDLPTQDIPGSQNDHTLTKEKTS